MHHKCEFFLDSAKIDFSIPNQIKSIIFENTLTNKHINVENFRNSFHNYYPMINLSID